MDGQERIKIVTSSESDFIMEEAKKLPKDLERYYRRRVPFKKPHLERITLAEKLQIRHILAGKISDHWYYLGEKVEIACAGKVYGPDKHGKSGLRSYCVLMNGVKAAALVCKNLEAQFSRKVKCYCIPYVERAWADRPYTWIRVKVLFNN